MHWFTNSVVLDQSPVKEECQSQLACLWSLTYNHKIGTEKQINKRCHWKAQQKGNETQIQGNVLTKVFISGHKDDDIVNNTNHLILDK